MIFPEKARYVCEEVAKGLIIGTARYGRTGLSLGQQNISIKKATFQS
jgi:hypothetical protein